MTSPSTSNTRLAGSTVPNPEPDTPRRRTGCMHYAPPSGSRRCLHYLDSGACQRRAEFMCIEWLKANGHEVTAAHISGSDRAASAGACPAADEAWAQLPSPKVSEMRRPALNLFGEKEIEPKRRQRPVAHKPAAVACPVLYPEDIEPPVPPPGLTAEAIERFRSHGCIAGLDSDTFGPLWVVPEYTDHDRPEISLEHAATLHHVLQVFPGSQVVSYETNPESQSEPNQEA